MSSDVEFTTREEEPEFLINSDSGKVHRATCSSTTPTHPGDGWWFMPWTPAITHPTDTACRRCLGGVLPTDQEKTVTTTPVTPVPDWHPDHPDRQAARAERTERHRVEREAVAARHATERAEERLRDTTAAVVAANLLSEREAWALNASMELALTAAEGRELLDFLGYPDPKPQGRGWTTAVVLRILDARARGVHIA